MHSYCGIMVNKLIPPALLLALIGSLSACGDIKGALEFADQGEAFKSSLDQLQNRSNTAYLGVPELGEETYRGEASLGIGSSGGGFVLLGDATVTVDYKNRDISGDLTNFSGFDSDENFTQYAGGLDLQSGILGSGNPNDVEAQVVGTLTGDGRVIEVDAFWEGHLKGTPIIGVLGDTTSNQSTFQLNGEEVSGGMVIAVTN